MGARAAAVLLALGLFAPMAAAGEAPQSPGVTRVTLALVDRSRPTAAQGGAAEQSTRTLVTVVSHPKRQRGPLPLIVFATGVGGTTTNYAPVYDDWVRAGYVVAAPEFPLSGEHAPGGPNAGDLANQPGDVAFIVRELIARNEARGKLRGLIDTDRIAIAGKSLGAVTVFASGFDPKQQIPDLRAVIAMTGTAIDDGTFFKGIRTPLLLLHGDADTTVPIDGSRAAFAKAEGPAFFVTLLGQTHGSAFQGDGSPAAEVVAKTSVDFLNRYVKDRPRALDRLLTDADVPGVSTVESRE